MPKIAHLSFCFEYSQLHNPINHTKILYLHKKSWLAIMNNKCRNNSKDQQLCSFMCKMCCRYISFSFANWHHNMRSNFHYQDGIHLLTKYLVFPFTHTVSMWKLKLKYIFALPLFVHWDKASQHHRTRKARIRLSMAVNTSRPRQNGRHFPDDIFECIFFNELLWISIKI